MLNDEGAEVVAFSFSVMTPLLHSTVELARETLSIGVFDVAGDDERLIASFVAACREEVPS